jgi:hypothetical protein
MKIYQWIFVIILILILSVIFAFKTPIVKKYCNKIATHETGDHSMWGIQGYTDYDEYLSCMNKFGIKNP